MELFSLSLLRNKNNILLGILKIRFEPKKETKYGGIREWNDFDAAFWGRHWSPLPSPPSPSQMNRKLMGMERVAAEALAATAIIMSGFLPRISWQQKWAPAKSLMLFWVLLLQKNNTSMLTVVYTNSLKFRLWTIKMDWYFTFIRSDEEFKHNRSLVLFSSQC